MKSIATHLNRQAIMMRGRPWRIQKMDQILSNRVYIGEFYFNRTEYRTRSRKRRASGSRWTFRAIIDQDISTDRRAPPCSATQSDAGAAPCIASAAHRAHEMRGLWRRDDTGNGQERPVSVLQMHDADGQGRGSLQGPQPQPRVHGTGSFDDTGRKVFTPARVEVMLRELRKRQRAARPAEDARLQELVRELKEVDSGIARLYEAVEKGLLPLDTTLQERSQRLQARRQDILSRAGRAAQQMGDFGQPAHAGAHCEICRAL